MKVTIKSKNENPLLGRMEVEGQITFEGVTPSNAQLIEVLVKEMKTKPELVIIKNIYTKFSQQESAFSALVYKNAEAKDKAEMNTKFLKKKAEEDAKKVAEAKKAEAEEKKKAEEDAKTAEEDAKAAEEAKKAEAEKPTEEKKEEAPATEEKAE